MITEDKPTWAERNIALISTACTVILLGAAIALLGWKLAFGIWFLLSAARLQLYKPDA